MGIAVRLLLKILWIKNSSDDSWAIQQSFWNLRDYFSRSSTFYEGSLMKRYWTILIEKTNVCTLRDQIAVHLRLFIFGQNTLLYFLIQSCIFKFFWNVLTKIQFFANLSLKNSILQPCTFLFDPVFLLNLKYSTLLYAYSILYGNLIPQSM